LSAVALTPEVRAARSTYLTQCSQRHVRSYLHDFYIASWKSRRASAVSAVVSGAVIVDQSAHRPA